MKLKKWQTQKLWRDELTQVLHLSVARVKWKGSCIFWWCCIRTSSWRSHQLHKWFGGLTGNLLFLCLLQTPLWPSLHGVSQNMSKPSSPNWMFSEYDQGITKRHVDPSPQENSQLGLTSAAFEGPSTVSLTPACSRCFVGHQGQPITICWILKRSETAEQLIRLGTNDMLWCIPCCLFTSENVIGHPTIKQVNTECLKKLPVCRHSRKSGISTQ